MAVSRGAAAAPDRRNSRPSSASTASTGDAPRLTSDMISFRATVIHADPADLEGMLPPSARPLAATAVDDRKAAQGKRRHTVAGDSPDLVPRFSALKIDPAPASQQRAPPIGSGFMYARASSFTLGSSSSVAATYSFLPDQTPPPSASTTARLASALVTPSASASATVYGALVRTAARLGDAPALLVPPADRKPATASTVWTPPTESVSWRQLLARVRRSARVLLRLGFAPGEALVVAARSSPDMYALHLAAVALGGVVAHVRSTWRSSDLADCILPAARARVLVVDRLVDAVVDALGDAADSLRAVIVLDRDQDPVDLLLRVDAPVNVLTIADVEALAADDEASGTPSTEQVERAAASVSPAQCCAIEFGLDANGRIRGVKLSHDNVLFTAATVAQSLGPLSSQDRMLGYLPLHHVASQVLEIFVPVVCGLSVTCVPSSKPLMQVISTAKPTVLFATPATWSSVSSQVYRAKRDANAVLYRWAKTRATNNAKKQLFELKEQQGQPSSPRKKSHHRSLGYILAKKLVLNAIKRKIGLESCTACFSVLAPLDFELERLFQTVDLPLYQLGGTAEATGFAALNCPRAWELGAAGRALRRTLLRCDESTQDVLLRGRNVFMGHVRCENGIVREEPHVGWLALPQRGFLTPTGFLTLNDPRDFVVLGTGDWVPIKPLERAITEDHPELARAVLIGDGRAFLSVLLFLQTAAPGASCTPTSFPSFQSQPGAVHSSNRGTRALGYSNQLSEDALQIARAIGSKATTVPEAIRCQAWAVYLDDLIESLPTRCSVAAAGFRVRKWMIMAGSFSVETGEIDPETGDVKRRAVEHKYQALLDTLYS